MSHREPDTGGIILAASDLHGNTRQYNRIFSCAIERQCGGIILCGDITPKGLRFNAQDQRDFLMDYLFPKLDEVHRQRGTPLPVFLMMGNDDLRANEHILVENQERHNYAYIHNRIVPFGAFHIAGYSCIPPTPHGCKDWEKPDGGEAFADRGMFRNHGWVSRGGERVPCYIGGIRTIAQDLLKMFSGFTAFDKTIFACHAPPYGSKLDMLKQDGRHVGSMAIREFLQHKRPLLSLHGHIHETVMMSGSWQDRMGVGGNPALAVGNFPADPSPHVILIDISGAKPGVQRMQLTETGLASGGDANSASLIGITVRNFKRRFMPPYARPAAYGKAWTG